MDICGGAGHRGAGDRPGGPLWAGAPLGPHSSPGCERPVWAVGLGQRHGQGPSQSSQQRPPDAGPGAALGCKGPPRLRPGGRPGGAGHLRPGQRGAAPSRHLRRLPGRRRPARRPPAGLRRRRWVVDGRQRRAGADSVPLRGGHVPVPPGAAKPPGALPGLARGRLHPRPADVVVGPVPAGASAGPPPLGEPQPTHGLDGPARALSESGEGADGIRTRSRWCRAKPHAQPERDTRPDGRVAGKTSRHDCWVCDLQHRHPGREPHRPPHVPPHHLRAVGAQPGVPRRQVIRS
mmetsp:Transcript_36925/g.85362  ORF Transcript_36925/g.85362 Transcript_36925/m.85362 type:complete len:291 (-) Transcript_36925:256-1128(-)